MKQESDQTGRSHVAENLTAEGGVQGPHIINLQSA